MKREDQLVTLQKHNDFAYGLKVRISDRNWTFESLFNYPQKVKIAKMEFMTKLNRLGIQQDSADFYGFIEDCTVDNIFID